MSSTRDDQPEQRLRQELVEFQAGHPDLPALPDLPGRYESWFTEVKRRVALRSQQRTAEQQLRLLKQINEYHAQYLALIQTQRKINTELRQADADTKTDDLRVKKEQKTLELEILRIEQPLEELRAPKSATAPAKEQNENEKQFDAGVDERLLVKRWEIHEAMGKVTTLRELHRWKKDQRAKIIHDKALTEAEKVEELECVDSEYDAFRRQLDRDTAIFEDK